MFFSEVGHIRSETTRNNSLVPSRRWSCRREIPPEGVLDVVCLGTVNTQFLIDAVMRQTTILVAKLATAGGVRAPLSRISNQVFLDLSAELHSQGISRKVSADMFGMALRAYLKKIQRLSESTTDQGRSLWQAVFEYVSERPVTSRSDVQHRFHNDEEALLRGILHDLCESALLSASGSGPSTMYRSISDDELGYMRGAHPDSGADEMLWVMIYREGPLSLEQLVAHGNAEESAVEICLERLLTNGRVQQDDAERYTATQFHVARDAEVGWEAAFFDHYLALVKTLCCRLNPEPGLELPEGSIGGSTYTFDVWPEHPLYGEVLSVLGRYREAQDALGQRVDSYNDKHGLPDDHRKVVVYAGQCVLPVTPDEDSD